MKSALPFVLIMVAQTASAQPPEGLWLSQDQSVILASGACGNDSPNLCAIIVGLKDDSLRRWSDAFCGLPIFWDLQPGETQGAWINGQLLGPATERVTPVNLTVNTSQIFLSPSTGGTIIWQKTDEEPSDCGGN